MNAGPGQEHGDQGWWDPSHPSSQPTPPHDRRQSSYPAPDQPPIDAEAGQSGYDDGRPQFEYPATGYESTGYQNSGYQGSGYQDTGYQDTGYATTGYQTADYPAPVEHSTPEPMPTRRRSGRAGLVVLVAVLTLVIGSASGYVAGRLGGQSTATPTAGAPPTTGGGPTEEPTGQESPEPAPAPPPNSSDTVAIAEAVLPSTVTIRVEAGGGAGLGSGFVIDGDGRVMTNNHVVAAADDGGSITVTLPDGTTSAAELLGRSPSYDLAVIQVEDPDDLRPVRFGDSDAAEVGSMAVAIGSPLGLGGTVTQGIISAVDRPVAVGSDSPDGAAYLNALQTDAPINRGNSGGPLVNGNAEVIGVNSAILTGSSSSDESGNIGIGFAIPINQADEIAKLLIRDGHATYPVINASVTANDSGDGVTLSSVESGGAADEAGLRAGDVVRAVDNESVSRSEDLIVAIRNHRPGDTVTLKIDRNGDTREVPVELGSKRG